VTGFLRSATLACLALGQLGAVVLADDNGLRQESVVAFVEGPAWRSDGVVFFTDIPNDRIMRRNPDGSTTVHRSPAGHANGLYVDGQDRLLIAEDEGRLVRESPDGTIEVLADEYESRPFNSLNDVAVDTKGRIYFTDPRGKNRSAAPQRDAQGEVIDGVYRVDASGAITRLLTHELDQPNGIAVAPNDQYLYITDNDGQTEGGARKLWRFDLTETGDVVISSKKLLFDWGQDRGPDGMTLDTEGHVYVAAGFNHPKRFKSSLVYKAGIYVITPEGKLLNFIAVPMDTVSNVTFGGEPLNTLYITAGHSLWSIDIAATGYRPFSEYKE